MEEYGFSHVWAQGDFVTRAIVVVLLVMSILSWTVIVVKSWHLLRLKRITRNAEQEFWHSENFSAGLQKLGNVSDNPFSSLALAGQEAAEHHRHSQPQLHDRLDISDWITRCLKDSVDQSVTRMQSGLAVLASIGSTAPFVGLFGTVWGIYHALLAIGASGQTTIDKVAGPVGEALIMTAFGLFVAIPAVLGYNALTRANKTVLTKLNRFAHSLHGFFVTGASLHAPQFGGGAASVSQVHPTVAKPTTRAQ